MDYFKDGEEFAQKYVWNKFTNSWVTLLGGLSTVVVPLGITLSPLPAIFQIFTLLPISAVLSSFYWYTIANAELYAKEGATLFEEYYKKERKETLLREFTSLEFDDENEALKEELKKVYDAFVEALHRQKIISEVFKNTALIKVEEAFTSGIKLLKEIRDIVSVLKDSSLEELHHDMRDAEDADKVFIEQKIEIHSANELQLYELTRSLKELIHSFEKSKLSLAHASSSFEGKEEADEKMKSMLAAIEVAKRVQKRQSSVANIDTSRYIK